MTFLKFILKVLRKIIVSVKGTPSDAMINTRYVQFFEEKGNELISLRLSKSQNKGYAICKFGTIELACIAAYLLKKESRGKFLKTYLRGYPVPMFYEDEIARLHSNAGFFPPTLDMGDEYSKMTLNEIRGIDILASYAYAECYIEGYLRNCVKVDLEGFYAPWLYEKPWTRILKGKKVLVIHPFVRSIQSQYQRRGYLFDNPDVLPEFGALHVIKAVQSIAGEETEFASWFEALDHMKREMEKIDFDIALIGCGAYGMPLALHAKKIGKIGIHLAGWTQMLFGIYGKRWIEDQPQHAKYINKYWIRPSEDEKPSRALRVEGGCYW